MKVSATTLALPATAAHIAVNRSIELTDANTPRNFVVEVDDSDTLPLVHHLDLTFCADSAMITLIVRAYAVRFAAM